MNEIQSSTLEQLSALAAVAWSITGLDNGLSPKIR